MATHQLTLTLALEPDVIEELDECAAEVGVPVSVFLSYFIATALGDTDLIEATLEAIDEDLTSE